MVLACARPWRHPRSGVYWYRRRIPEPLRPLLRRGELRYTLATRDPREAKVRHLRLDGTIEGEFRSLLGGVPPQGLTCANHISPFRGGFDVQAPPNLLQASREATAAPTPAEPVSAPSPKLAFPELFDAYATAAGLSPATRKRWRPAILRLAVFAGNDDARRITAEIIADWKAALLAEGLSPVTVRDVYLASAKATLNWAVEERRLKINPAAGARVRVPRQTLTRERGFTDDEADSILRASLARQDARISPENAAVRRWVPWILSLTGARVNEITQLRGQDVRERDGIAFIRITPEAGRVKTGRYRDVPIHPALMAQGFARFVEARGRGPLFYNPARSSGSDQNPIYKRMGQKLAEWVRTIVPDPGVDPNHGWRHRFKTIGRAADIPQEHLDALQGHAPANVGASYGTFPLPILAASVAKIPIALR